MFNKLTTGLFDLVFRPFLGLDPIWAMLVVSFLTGILMLWIFGKVSNQDAIRTIRDRIRGNLIAIRLYGDDLKLLFRLQGRILRQTLTYMRHALVPMLVMLLPVLVVIIQLNLRYAVRPLAPGKPTLVKAKLEGTPPVTDGVELEVPDGLVVETEGVRIEAQREVAWRIRAERAGEYRLAVLAGDQRVEKDLRVGNGWGAVSTLKTGEGFWQKLLYPGEPPIPAGRIARVEVNYDPLPLTVFGFPVHWLVAFFILSILFGFAFRRVLGVEI